jgi:hypothetical protein
VSTTDLFGLIFILAFFGLMLFFAFTGRKKTQRYLRDIPAFSRLRRGIGLAVEAGQRLHISLGRGGVVGVEGASAFVGLSMLQRIARAASISDRPPVATSGEGTLAVLSQDTLQSVYHSIGADSQYEPSSGQVSGLTPFSYAAGAMPVIFDHQVAVNILAGHFGSEVALLTDAAERSGALTLAGSDSIPAQAVLYATAQEPLIGEELYAGGAYIQAGPMHLASVRAQDIMRWVLIGGTLLLAVLKLVGVM